MAIRSGKFYYADNCQCCSNWEDVNEWNMPPWEDVCWCISAGWSSHEEACRLGWSERNETILEGKVFAVEWDDEDVACGDVNAGPYCVDGLRVNFSYIFSAPCLSEDIDCGSGAGLLLNLGYNCDTFQSHEDPSAGIGGDDNPQTIRNILTGAAINPAWPQPGEYFHILVADGTDNVYSVGIDGTGLLHIIDACEEDEECPTHQGPVFKVIKDGECDCPCEDCEEE